MAKGICKDVYKRQIITMVLVILFSSTAGFALEKLRFKAHGAVLSYFLTGITIPIHITLIPLLDVYKRQDSAKAEAIRMLVGGDAFNVASNLSALGTETTLYSAVGEDAFGAFALDYAEKLGVSTQWIKTTDGPTAVTAVLIHPDGERSFVVQRGASHELKERQISDDLLRQYDLLYIGSACGIPGLDGEGLTKLLHRAKELDCKRCV